MHSGVWRWLALISFTIGNISFAAGGRPAYGGELRVQTSGNLAQLHPTSSIAMDVSSSTGLRLLPLVFETLVMINDQGEPEPLLADSWTASADFRHWSVSLRPNIRFHDGSPLDSSAVLDCLTSRENPFIVMEYRGRIMIESADPQPELLQDLARPERGIFKNSPNGEAQGTGPFRIAEWESGRRGVLVAFEQHWKGRPFLDRILLEMDQDTRDQWIDLEMGRADLIEIPIENATAAAQAGYRLLSSRPLELMALSFGPAVSTPSYAQDLDFRRALALAIDREAIHRVLLQGQGEATASLLPQWMTGFSFLFSDLRHIDSHIDSLDSPQLPLSNEFQLSLGYSTRDRLAHSIANRLALDLRSAGIRLRPLPLASPSRDSYLADLMLVRIQIATVNQKHALLDLASRLFLPTPQATDWNQPEAVFKAERELLKDFRVIPLFHLSSHYAVSKRVRFYRPEDIFLTNALNLADVWVENVQ